MREPGQIICTHKTYSCDCQASADFILEAKYDRGKSMIGSRACLNHVMLDILDMMKSKYDLESLTIVRLRQ